MTHRRAVALMIIATLLWSIAGVVTRHLDSVRSFEVTFWRSLFNALALLVALSAMRGAALWHGLLHARWPFWVSTLCWALMFTAFMVAITLTTVANVLVTLAIGPLITALFARVFLGHRLSGRTWSAIAVAGCGIAWMFGREAMAGVSPLGTLVALIVPLAAAVNWVVLQFVAHDNTVREAGSSADMLPAVLIGAGLSALATLPLAYPFQASGHDMGLLALLGIAQNAIPCLLAVRLTRELPAAEISLLGLLEVLFGVAWVWLIAGEQPGPDTLIGSTLVLGALVCNELLELKQKRALAVQT
jgi:drug/metabolite transporter (DMT)-like permease